MLERVRITFLKPGAAFVLTCLNGIRDYRRFSQADAESGRLDPLTGATSREEEVQTAAGPKLTTLRDKGHTPVELRLLMRLAGLEVRSIGNGTAGQWRAGALDLDAIELMAVAQKRG